MLKALLIFLTFSLIIAKASAQVNLAAGLVANYTFSGNVSDITGNGHSGQAINGGQFGTDRFGNANSAYLFDGIDDYIRVADNGAFSTPSFSLVIWFQSQTDNLQNLVGKRDFTTPGGTAGAQYQFFINYQPFPGIGSNLVGNNSTCTSITSSSYINTNDWICRTKWYCAVITFDGASHKIYIDGVLKRNEPTAFNGFLACSSDLRFGNWWQGDLLPFKGMMDDISWYNRALNQAEATALYDNFSNVSGQCSPNAGAGFLAPDTVCVNTPVTVSNTSVGASSFYWNFCVANSTANPIGTNLGTFGTSSPVFSDYAKDGNNYYAFVTNNVPGKLVRLDFGNSLLNTPTYVDMGDFGSVIPNQTEGIQLIKNEGRWYAIIVGGQPVGRIVKIDFGASLSNPAPTATNWGNVGNLAYPTDLHVFQDGTNWYGLTINAQTNTITRFNFTSSFTNTPTGVNLGNIGSLDYPTGIYAINNNGSWHAFITNAGVASGFNSPTSSLTRLDFGSSLLNTPTGTNLGNPGGLFRSARDLTIYKSCNEIFGFAVNYSTANDIIRLNFSNNLTAVPSAVSLGNTGALSFPHSISKLFRVDNDLYSFIPNVTSNSLTRLKFTGCSNSSIANSTLQNPPPITYNAVGTYNINLTVDDGLATQAAYCKQVVVVSNTHTPLQLKTVCDGDSVLLTSSKPFGNIWNTGSTAASIYVKTAGIYWVQSTAGTCTNVDSFAVSVKPKPVVNIGIDTSICSSDSLLLDAGNAGATYVWQGGQTTQTIRVRLAGVYHVSVTKDGCTAKDSVTVSLSASPVITVSPDTTICAGAQITLTATGGVNYNWSPGAGLSGNSGASVTAAPAATTQYYVTVTNAANCTAKDSVLITVVPKPLVNIGADTTLCTLDSLILNGGNTGATYLWQNNQTTQTIMVRQAGTYYVAVNLNGCVVSDTILITNLPSPQLIVSNDTAICRLDSILLSASGADSYSWSPSAGLSTTNASATWAMPATTTTYRVTGTNTNLCTARDSVTITVAPKPVVNIGADTTLCTLDSLLLDAGNAGAIYTWQNGQSTQTFLAVQSGWYYVTVSKDGCLTRDSILISSLPSPVVTVSADTTICEAGKAVLTAGGGMAYSWLPVTGLSNPGGAITIASPASSTIYNVTVTAANNCTATRSLLLSVNPKPDFTVTASKPVLCIGDTVMLTATGGDRYVWSPATSLSDPLGSLTLAYPTVSTVYKVIVENDGCRLTDSLFLPVRMADKPEAAITKSNDINCILGQATLTANGGNSYLWTPAIGLSNATVRSPVVSITQTTVYHVLVTTADGCQVMDSVTVNVSKDGDGSGFLVPSAFTPNNDGKNDCFGVKHWGGVTNFSLNIYNRWGELVFGTSDASKCWNGMYKGVMQPGDVYVYWIKAKTFCGDVFRKGTLALIR